MLGIGSSEAFRHEALKIWRSKLPFVNSVKLFQWDSLSSILRERTQDPDGP
jgi:hypothetical protein